MKKTHSTRPSQGAPLKKLDGSWRRTVGAKRFEYDSTCSKCGYHVCTCAAAAEPEKPRIVSSKPRDTQPEQLARLKAQGWIPLGKAPVLGSLATVAGHGDQFFRVAAIEGTELILRRGPRARRTKLRARPGDYDLTLWSEARDEYGRTCYALTIGQAVHHILRGSQVFYVGGFDEDGDPDIREDAYDEGRSHWSYQVRPVGAE